MTGPYKVLFDSLTRREREVLRMLALGLSPKEIATEGFVSMATVRSQISGVLAKLCAASVTSAVALSYRTGWSVADLIQEKTS